MCRERGALVIVDGQQRCTTMMMLLAAIRDLEEERPLELSPPELEDAMTLATLCGVEVKLSLERRPLARKRRKRRR